MPDCQAKIRQNRVLNYVKIKRILVENGRVIVKQWQKYTNRIHTHKPNYSGPDPVSIEVCATLLSCSIHKDVSKFMLAGEQTDPRCGTCSLQPSSALASCVVVKQSMAEQWGDELGGGRARLLLHGLLPHSSVTWMAILKVLLAIFSMWLIYFPFSFPGAGCIPQVNIGLCSALTQLRTDLWGWFGH